MSVWKEVQSINRVSLCVCVCVRAVVSSTYTVSASEMIYTTVISNWPITELLISNVEKEKYLKKYMKVK